jgi:sporulation protein YlmC with PRC-barrel domain
VIHPAEIWPPPERGPSLKKSMKLTQLRLAAAIAAPLCLWAEAATPPRLGKEKAFDEYHKIVVQNLQGQTLGRIKDLGVDLINGRIVEVFIASDRSLDLGGKIVAVPPLALVPDPANEVYRLDVSTETFQSAAGIDLTPWIEAGHSAHVAAAYHHFGRETYFLEEGDTANPKDARPKVSLGYVERSSQLLDRPVGNFQGEKFGKVWSLTLDIPKGRILNVIILSPGNLETKRIVPAMALSFNATRDALLLDDTREEFADQPHYIYTPAAFGNDANYHRESYKGPHTHVALAQGSSYRDIDRTVQISRDIRAAKIGSRNVQVGTVDGRVTLRGWVNTAADKTRILALAVAASRLELVDDQISVGRPIVSSK